MGVLVQIRDVPEDTHRILKSRAALGGVSLSEYLRAMLARAAARPTPEELEARIAARGSVTLPVSSAEVVREIREHGE
jgi:plasmid stability protein